MLWSWNYRSYGNKTTVGNGCTSLLCVDPAELIWGLAQPDSEGPPECSAGSAGTLITQLAVGTKLSILTPRDRKGWETVEECDFSSFFCWNCSHTHTHHTNTQTHTHTSMHKCNEASHLLLLASHVWQSPVSSTKSGGIREKKRGKTSPNRKKEGAQTAPFILPFYDLLNVLEEVLGGIKLQSLWCLWIRGVDRRKSGQQGCSSESGWRYAGGFQTHWKKSRRGKISSQTKAEEQSSHWGEALSCWGVILGVPQGCLPSLPSQMRDKRPRVSPG